MTTPSHIDTEPRPACSLCGDTGEIRYRGLEDVLFGAPGQWSLRGCRTPDCGLLWLDPSPRPDEIGKAYARYYTHQAPADAAGRLAVSHAYNLLWRVTAIGRERERLHDMCLDRVTPGRLLDVGCGDGRRLTRLVERGWRAEGQEVDPAAAAQARARGVTVHVGTLEALALPSGRYDAVTLSHVIEHVPSPEATLVECRRLLRPGGRLVALTPNAAGLGHTRYRQAWRGLEPPRHLQIFTPSTLARVARRAGFAEVDATSSAANAYTISALSLDVAGRQTGKSVGFVRSRVEALLFQLWASARWRSNRDLGEECVLEARA
jgi:SAM-dependent methyltransferase